MAKRPGGTMLQGAEPTRSQLIPVIAKWQELGNRSQFMPVIFCIVAFFAMATFGSTDTITVPIPTLDGQGYVDPRHWIYTSSFLIMVGLFLTLASLYLIYTMVGKRKSWWVLLGAMAFTAYFVWLLLVAHDFGWVYDFFHLHLAGGEPDDNAPFLQLFIQHFLGTGFFEEIVKALPVFALVWATRYMSPSLRAKIGVEEPLDGILIGAAAGGGFAIMETLCQFVSGELVKQWLVMAMAFQHVKEADMAKTIAAMTGQQLLTTIKAGSDILGTSPGFPSLIIRSIDLAFGHMAYSGYFGYFIGLSVLKPQQRWKILGIGLISASIPHALWDTVTSMNTAPLEAAVALLSYAVLAAAVLKAREISPNRGILQPSMLLGSQLMPAPVGVPAAVDRIVMAPVAPAVLPSPHAETPSYGEPGTGGNRLRVGAKFLVIVPGLRLLEHQVPGLAAQAAGGAVAEVTRNPNDPSVLGLTNLSTSTWEVVSGNGVRRQIPPGQTIKLAPGAKIDFGSIDGEVG